MSRRSNTSWLHVSSRSRTARTEPAGGEPAGQLVGLADGDRPAAGIGHEDHPEMDLADLGRVVVEQPDEAVIGLEVRDELLAPLAGQPAVDVDVARVEVAADPDRPPIVETPVRPAAGPLHEEPARTVAQDEVRDDLLERRVDLHRRTRREPPARGDDLEDALGARGPDPVPARPGHDELAGHDVDLLGGPGLDRHGSSRRRAASNRAASASTSGSAASSRAAHSARPAEIARTAAAISGPFVAAIPAPMSGAPRREPGHVAPAAGGQRPGERPVGPTGHRLDERRRHDERGMADRRDRPVVGGRIQPDRLRPGRPGEALDPIHVGRRGVGARTDDPGPVDEQVGLGRRVAGRVAAGHRMAADEAQAEPIGPLDDDGFRARDVGDRRAGRKGAGERATELVEQVEALERRRGQDDEVGPVDGLTERRRGSPDDAIGERRPGARRASGSRRPGRPVQRGSRRLPVEPSARAIDPPMSPNPTIAIRTRPIIAGPDRPVRGRGSPTRACRRWAAAGPPPDRGRGARIGP